MADKQHQAAAITFAELARLATLDLGQGITVQEISALVNDGAYPERLDGDDRRDLWATVAKEMLSAGARPPLSVAAEAMGSEREIPRGLERPGPLGRQSLEEGLLELAIGSKAVADLKRLAREP